MDESEGSGSEAGERAPDRPDVSPGDDRFDRDVVVVGGGPAGSSAGVFLARAGLDTAVFDRGRSSLARCAFLENYPGFPAGIDVGTFTDLLHDHAETAGCAVVPDLVTSVRRAESGDLPDDDAGGAGDAEGADEENADAEAPVGFVVEPQEGDPLTARYVVAATRYGGDYLRGLDDAMFVPDGYGGEEFDREYAAADGASPTTGLYVASPSTEADRQAVVAAGRGARVALALVDDDRRTRGHPDATATRYDWLRRDAELTDEWANRDRWREYFAERLPAEPAASEDRLAALREADIDRRLGAYVDEEDVAERTEQGQRRLLDHLDDDVILAAAAEIREERADAAADDD